MDIGRTTLVMTVETRIQVACAAIRCKMEHMDGRGLEKWEKTYRGSYYLAIQSQSRCCYALGVSYLFECQLYHCLEGLKLSSGFCYLQVIKP